MKDVKYPIYDDGQLHVSISSRNNKVGNIPQFNTLPGNGLLTLANGQLLTNIEGTCGSYCEGCKKTCYAIRCAIRHHNSVIPAWAKNTAILRNDPEKVKKEIKEYCNKNIVKYFRFHTSGELESIEQLRLYCEICEENSDIVFYMYTKRFDLLAEYFVTMKNRVPGNFIINLSEWHGNVHEFVAKRNSKEIADFFSSLNVFSYDDHTPESIYAKDLTHCPAINVNGHETGITCAQCRRCMRKGSRTAVHKH